MKHLFIFCFLSLLSLVFLSCGKSQTEAIVPADYSGWKSSHEGFLEYPIPGHMDNYRKIYFSSQGESVEEGEEYPDGTVIIKEIYNKENTDTPAQLTVMIKDSNSNDARGGWKWVVKNTDTGTEVLIRSEFCFTCHTDANVSNPYGDRNSSGTFRDYVFIPLFSSDSIIKY